MGCGGEGRGWVEVECFAGTMVWVEFEGCVCVGEC